MCSHTETWFNTYHIVVKFVVPSGYTMKHIPRANARGVIIVFRESISMTVSKHNSYTSIVYVNCLIKVYLELMRFVTIYIPPPKAKSSNVPAFLKGFADRSPRGLHSYTWPTATGWRPEFALWQTHQCTDKTDHRPSFRNKPPTACYPGKSPERSHPRCYFNDIWRDTYCRYHLWWIG